MKGWMDNGILPKPFCREVGTEYVQYARFELDALAAILAEHEQTSTYITKNDHALIDRIGNDIRAARQAFIEG